MKNKDKYFDEIIQATIEYSYCSFARKHMKDYDFKLKEYKEYGGQKLCSGKECEKCKKYFVTWLEQEYVEKPKLSHDEYVILKNMILNCGWLVRNISDVLEFHYEKPKKEKGTWKENGYYNELHLFSHLFVFIKWEDEEPYNIQKLLDEYESYVICY